MKYKINYSDESVKDLFGIYDYIAIRENEKANALKLINSITNVVKSLDVFPLRYPVVSFSPWKERSIRYLPIKNCVVFYYVNENKFTVNIIRIFSSKKDIKSIVENQ